MKYCLTRGQEKQLSFMKGDFMMMDFMERMKMNWFSLIIGIEGQQS